ncbi:hypothetical protein DQ04_14671010 [Trypanosoma grayi]|uniref:hypothetical protein n=1 Tax=Trypanosoma grayi TaxID=71804 RepID=UPI0004F41341|nr:hypothetical protein DQ04_14671010 [Trypanosoma grayi]KEG06312.1 hypothetical protein DQ04_14671010 [Trypanosoma grayi]
MASIERPCGLEFGRAFEGARSVLSAEWAKLATQSSYLAYWHKCARVKLADEMLKIQKTANAQFHEMDTQLAQTYQQLQQLPTELDTARQCE